MSTETEKKLIEHFEHLSAAQQESIIQLVRVMRDDKTLSPSKALVDVFETWSGPNKGPYARYSNNDIASWCRKQARARNVPD